MLDRLEFIEEENSYKVSSKSFFNSSERFSKIDRSYECLIILKIKKFIWFDLEIKLNLCKTLLEVEKLNLSNIEPVILHNLKR